MMENRWKIQAENKIGEKLNGKEEMQGRDM